MAVKTPFSSLTINLTGNLTCQPDREKLKKLNSWRWGASRERIEVKNRFFCGISHVVNGGTSNA